MSGVRTQLLPNRYYVAFGSIALPRLGPSVLAGGPLLEIWRSMMRGRIVQAHDLNPWRSRSFDVGIEDENVAVWAVKVMHPELSNWRFDGRERLSPTAIAYLDLSSGEVRERCILPVLDDQRVSAPEVTSLFGALVDQEGCRSRRKSSSQAGACATFRRSTTSETLHATDLSLPKFTAFIRPLTPRELATRHKGRGWVAVP